MEKVLLSNMFFLLLLVNCSSSIKEHDNTYDEIDKTYKPLNEPKEPSMDLNQENILHYFDSTLINNSKVLYPKLANIEGCVYGKSKVSIFKDSINNITITIEKILLHEAGRISNESYFFGSALDSIAATNRSGYFKNIFYTTIVDYDIFDSLFNNHGEIEINSGFNLMNYRGERISYSKLKSDYDKIWEQESTQPQDIIIPYIFFRYLLDNNDSKLFFLKDEEFEAHIPKGQRRYCFTENWFYEDISNMNQQIISKPSETVLFEEIARVLSENDTVFHFDSYNTHWSDWSLQ